MSGVRRAGRFAAAVFAVAGVVSGCGSGGDSAATTSAAPDTTAAATTTTDTAPETSVVATTDEPTTTEVVPTTTTPWTPPFEHGCDETGPTRATAPTYDEVALDRFGPIGVMPAVEIALPFDLSGQPARSSEVRVPGGMLLVIRAGQTLDDAGAMLTVVDHDGAVRWTRCLGGYVDVTVASASDVPRSVVVHRTSAAVPSGETTLIALADGRDVGPFDDVVAASGLPPVEGGWWVSTAAGGSATVVPSGTLDDPDPDVDVFGVLDLVELTIEVVDRPADRYVGFRPDGIVEAVTADPGAVPTLLLIGDEWVEASGTPGLPDTAGFDFGGTTISLAGLDGTGDVRWRRDDITIPGMEGRFSAVSDDVVVAVFCAQVVTMDVSCDDFRSGGFSVATGETLWLDRGGWPAAEGDGAALVTGGSHGHDWVMIDVHTGALISEDQVWDGESTLFGEECCGGDEFLRVDQFGGVLYTVADQYVRIWLPADVAEPTVYLNLSGR